jgi:sugar phosphate isomerase/epimerase
VTPAAAGALRRTRFRNFELNFGIYAKDDEASRNSYEETRRLIREGIIRPASIHLPFCGSPGWDASTPDESVRKETSARFIKLIRDHADLIAPMATLHASPGGIALSEHPQRIGQVCKTIEELLPTAQELGFVINVEFLPRTCLGNCVEELIQIVSKFDPDQIGICMDVNHIMNRYRDLPSIIDTLAPHIRSFHLSDYDGVDEMHWIPGQGIIDWPAVMKHIRAIGHDVLLILETSCQLKSPSRTIDPLFSLRQNEKACWFLENCEQLVPQMEQFQIPGNQ